MIPFAAFLVGGLLTLLLPVALLIALAIWYWRFSVRVPETADGSGSRNERVAANPGPAIPEKLPPEPGA